MKLNEMARPLQLWTVWYLESVRSSEEARERMITKAGSTYGRAGTEEEDYEFYWIFVNMVLHDMQDSDLDLRDA